MSSGGVLRVHCFESVAQVVEFGGSGSKFRTHDLGLRTLTKP